MRNKKRAKKKMNIKLRILINYSLSKNFINEAQ